MTPAALRPGPQVGDAVGGQLGQVDGSLWPLSASLRASMQQRLDQPLAAVDRLTHRLAHRAQLADARVAVRQRDVDLGAHDRQRRAQLVRGARDEPPLARERPVETLEHPIEGVRELLELVGGAAQVDPLAEVLPRRPAARSR